MNRNEKTRKCGWLKRTLLIGLTLGLFSASAAAQSFVYRVDPTPVMTTRGNVPAGGFPQLYVVPGATITLCTDAACTIPATTYTNAMGDSSCPLSAQVTLPGSALCTSTAGPQGQFGFWIQPGTYYYQIRTVTGTFGPFPISSPTAGTLGGPGLVSANAAGGLAPMGAVLDCSRSTGSSASVQIAACASVLPSSGGVLDARNVQGSPLWNSDICSGITKPFVLLLPPVSISVIVTQTCGNYVHVIGSDIRGASILNWDGASNGTMMQTAVGTTGFQIDNVMLTTSVGGTTTALNLRYCVLCRVDNVSIGGFGTGINVTGDGASNVSNSVIVSNTRIENHVVTGISVDHTVELWLTSLDIAAAANDTTATNLLFDTGTSGVNGIGVSTTYGEHCVVFQNTGRNGSGSAPNFPKFTGGHLCDTSSGGDGILFDASLGTSRIGATFVDTWSAGAGRSNTNTQTYPGAACVRVSGGKQITWTAGQLRGCDAWGWIVDSANVSDWHVNEALITENNQGASGTVTPNASGIGIIAATTDWGISLNRIVDSPSGSQVYGIYIAAVAAAGGRISGNDLNGNATAALSNSSTAAPEILGNIPNTVPDLRADPIILNSSYIQGAAVGAAAGSGTLRMTDTGTAICWRDHAGSGDICISKDTLDRVNIQGGIQVEGGVSNGGAGIKHNRTSSCTTAASASATCDTTITWAGNAFADTSYTAACTLDAISGSVVVEGTTTKATGSMVVTIVNIGSLASAGVLNCIAMHD